jgi:hypothetical protein
MAQKDMDKLLKALKKKLSDEGGAAGFKPLKDIAKTMGVDLTPAMLKSMDGIMQHRDGDYILEEVKYPHMMYDPKTGKEVTAKTPEDHDKFAKMGYTHEKPKMNGEGNAFTKALMAARKAGDETFTVAGKEYKTENYDEDGNVKEAMDPVDPKAVKKDFKDRKDKDIDNDGDVDDSDKYLHKKRKAISKSINKNEDEPEGDNGETAVMNPKKENKATKESTIRERLMSIWEDAAGAKRMKDQNREPMTKDDERSAKKMKDGHPTERKGEKEADDSSNAERSGPSMKARSNDNMIGDKQIINKIANAYKTLAKGKDE